MYLQYLTHLISGLEGILHLGTFHTVTSTTSSPDYWPAQVVYAHGTSTLLADVLLFEIYTRALLRVRSTLAIDTGLCTMKKNNGTTGLFQSN